MPQERRGLLKLPVGFFLVACLLCVLRHDWLASWTFDLGVKSQVLFNCAAGRWLESSIEVEHYFGDHFNPTFLLLVPLYALVPSPTTLIIVQCASVAVGGVLIGLLARDWFPDRPHPALLAQAVFLLHPSTQNMVLYDFHENALAGTLVLGAVLAMERKRLGVAVLVGILAVGCKENGGLALAALGTWCVLRRRAWRAGLVLIPVGLAYTYLAIAVIMPHFSGEASDTLVRYAGLGDTPARILCNVFFRPHLFVLTVLQPAKLLYVLVLLLPALFVPLLRPVWLLPVAWVALPNLLTSRQEQFSGLYQYDALIIPFVVLAMLQAWRGIAKSGSATALAHRIPTLTVIVLILCLLNSRVWFWAGEAFVNIGRRADFARLVRDIPADAPLSASLNLGPHLVRRCLQEYPQLEWPAERFPSLPARRADYVIVDFLFEQRHRGSLREPQQKRLTEMGYALLSSESEFALYLRLAESGRSREESP